MPERQPDRYGRYFVWNRSYDQRQPASLHPDIFDRLKTGHKFGPPGQLAYGSVHDALEDYREAKDASEVCEV